MKPLIFVSIAFLVGCNGMGSGVNRFVPAAGPNVVSSAPNIVSADLPSARHGKTKVRVTLTVPHRHRERTQERHPATISAQTQSVGIAVNGGGAHVFNATPASPGCSITAKGTVCTFVVDAPIGNDTFVVATYSGTSGGGTMLDRGSAAFKVVTGKGNAPSITLGPVVTSTANSGVGSLRYAIGAANPGDTIMLMLPKGSVIAVLSPLAISNRVSIAGPGVTASARHHDALRSAATYAGVTISGGGAQQIFVLQPGSTATISGLILTAGNATVSDQPGGAVYNAGTLTLSADVFTDNTSAVTSPNVRRSPHGANVSRAKASHRRPTPPRRRPNCVGTDPYGGAVYNHGTLVVSDSTFDGNSVPSDPNACNYGYGGALYNDQYGILVSSGNLYANNSAYYGGAVYNNSTFGQASFTGDTFDANLGCTTATGCPLTSCVPTSTCTSAAIGYGAALYDAAGPGATIASSVFTNNRVGTGPDGYGEGGALDLTTGSPSVTGSSFTGNWAGGGNANCASGYGGAIFIEAGSAVVSSDTFTGNVAGGDYYGYGGAIYSYTAIQGSADKFASNVALSTGSPCGSGDGTSQVAEGGAIYTDEPLNLSGSTFTGNVATGSYYATGGAIDGDGQMKLSGDAFTSNQAVTTGSTGQYDYSYGGAIYNEDGLVLSNSTFTSNTATVKGPYDYYADGGAVYSVSTMSSTHDSFVSNTVVATGGYYESYGVGGAISSEDGALVSNGDTFKSNTASSAYESMGGAVYSEQKVLTISGGTFTGNAILRGTYGYGGAVYSDKAGSSITNSTFTSNSNAGSYGYGGAIEDDGGITIGGSVISNNTSSSYGGGFYADSATDLLANSTISGNKVTNAASDEGGGGIFTDNPLTVINSTISGNTVVATGIYAGGGGVYNGGGLAMTGSTISGNAVTGSVGGSGGGGVFSNDGVSMSNSTIAGNSSSVDGGGFLNESDPVTLTNVTMYQNKAANGSGGNIYNISATAAAIVLTNSIVAGGAAATGPDIANAGAMASGDYNIIQTVVSGTAFTGTTTHNQTADPKLLALANNGGPTFTNADQSTSPGHADIPYATPDCGGGIGIDVDQRGFSRGAGGRCDVGAFELGGVPSAIRSHPPVVHVHRHVPRTHRVTHPRSPK